MGRKNDRRSPNRVEPSWSADARADSYGPQGNALIMELQRLRDAFDNEGQDSRSGRTTLRPEARRPLEQESGQELLIRQSRQTDCCSTHPR